MYKYCTVGGKEVSIRELLIRAEKLGGRTLSGMEQAPGNERVAELYFREDH